MVLWMLLYMTNIPLMLLLNAMYQEKVFPNVNSNLYFISKPEMLQLPSLNCIMSKIHKQITNQTRKILYKLLQSEKLPLVISLPVLTLPWTPGPLLCSTVQLSLTFQVNAERELKPQRTKKQIFLPKSNVANYMQNLNSKNLLNGASLHKHTASSLPRLKN